MSFPYCRIPTDEDEDCHTHYGHTLGILLLCLTKSLPKQSNAVRLVIVTHLGQRAMKGKWNRKRPMPKRPNGRGTPRIKRSFGEVNGAYVGTINVSSGTNDPTTYHRLHSMLDDLAERGDADTLIRIRDNGRRGGLWSSGLKKGGRHHEILQVLRSWRHDRPIETITGWRPLAETMLEWLAEAQTRSSGPLSERTRKSYLNNVRQMLKFAELGDCEPPSDADLPGLLAGYRAWCIERKYWVPFNQVRTMCLSYARQTAPGGVDSPLYRQVRRTAGLTTKRKRERKLLTVRQVRDVMDKLPKREAQHVWNMCCLATRPDEYARDQWKIRYDDEFGFYVKIDGTKTSNAERVVPLAEGVEKAVFAQSTFRRRLRDAVGDKYLPRDFRSTGKRWWKEAGIEASRCRQYFGHSMAALEHRYETDELLPHVQADADLLNHFISSNLGSGMKGSRDLQPLRP
jgi:hypothetical protein